MMRLSFLFAIFIVVVGLCACSSPSSSPSSSENENGPGAVSNGFGNSSNNTNADWGNGGTDPANNPGPDETPRTDPGPAGNGGNESPPDDDPAGCIDLDGDLHGENCFLGADCDDTNPSFHESCPDCASATHTGCPCYQEGQNTYCYGADPNLNGIGVCQVGQRTCSSGNWTGCDGEVLPEPEKCDGKDNNCDGQVDEGVKSPCGNCDKFCQFEDQGPSTAIPFALNKNNSSSVNLTPEGWVTLDESTFGNRFIWIANSAENTVSKLDTETGKELGRYKVCGSPSRTAVDKFAGDCWVGCRNDGNVAKIINIPDKCIDKNGNGVIETSMDVNEDGKIDPNDPKEMISEVGADECIQFIVNAQSSAIRGAGVDSENYAWVGLSDQNIIRRLHPDTGEVVQSIDVGGTSYGMAIDQNSGIIWISARNNGALIRVDPKTSTAQSLSPPGCMQPYGIAVDPDGFVWIANHGCGGAVVWRYDPVNQSWASVATDDTPRGVVAGYDGFIYVANDSASRVAKVNAKTLTTVAYAVLGDGRSPVGVALAPDGHIWAVNQGYATTTKIEPVNMTVISEHPVGAGPYTYSDMTGSTFFQDIAPEGYFHTVYGGWEGYRVTWESVSVDYNAPPGTHIDLRVRSATSVDELDTATWSDPLGPFPPESFPVSLQKVLPLEADYLEVEVILYTESEEFKPVVKHIEIKYSAEPE